MLTFAEWSWMIIGTAVALAGVWLTALGRFRRRTRPARCCRACGYDMGGLGLTCPECGRVARSERELKRGPLRLVPRLAGVALAVVGSTLIDVPEMRVRGWAAALPDWGLALIAPADREFRQAPRRGWWGAQWRKPAPPQPRPFADQVRHDLAAETWHRIEHSAISRWFGSLFLRRVYHDFPLDQQLALDAPAGWPWDAPPPRIQHVRRYTYEYPAEIDAVATTLEGPADTMTVRLIAMVNGYRYTLLDQSIPLDATEAKADFMTAMSSSELDRRVFNVCTPRLEVFGGYAWVIVDTDFGGAVDARLPFFKATHMRIFYNDQEIAHGRFDEPLPASPTSLARVQWLAGADQLVLSSPDALTIELRGDPTVSLEHFLAGSYQSKTAWSGSFRGPLPVRK